MEYTEEMHTAVHRGFMSESVQTGLPDLVTRAVMTAADASGRHLRRDLTERSWLTCFL